MHKKQRQIKISTNTNGACHLTFQFSNLKIAGLAVSVSCGCGQICYFIIDKVFKKERKKEFSTF